MLRNNTLFSDRQALIFRLGVGSVFGLGAGWLGKMLELAHAMPDVWVHVTLSTLVLGGFVLLAGAGTMRRLSLAVWGAVALGVIAFIAWNHAANRLGDSLPSPLFFDDHFLIYPFLFIAHVLVSGADISVREGAGKLVAPYSLYFDESSKRLVQLILAVIFTVLFWSILWLGAALLGFIGFEWFRKLLENQYFAGPATGVALAAAVQLGDSQAKMLGHVKALVMGVLSWLLPVIVVIGVLFAVSLGFSGLAPLWSTKAATMTLLGGCTALVLLILAAYQQGGEERKVHVVMQWAVRLAAVLLLIFAVLAAYSLYLRIHQYGMTVERVLAAVGVSMAVLFGAGYTVAAVVPGRWFVLSERVNVGMAFIMVVIFAAVLTPLAEPARLSVDSQVARLQAGKVTADKFDWKLLRFNTGAYGTRALDSLIKTGKSADIRAAAVKAKSMKDEDRWGRVYPEKPVEFVPDPKRIRMLSADTVPGSFIAQHFTDEPVPFPSCLQGDKGICEGRMLDMDGDGRKELLLYSVPYLHVFTQGPEGWTQTDTGKTLSTEEAEAFRKGDITLEAPRWKNLRLGTSDPIQYRATPFKAPKSTETTVYTETSHY